MKITSSFLWKKGFKGSKTHSILSLFHEYIDQSHIAILGFEGGAWMQEWARIKSGFTLDTARVCCRAGQLRSLVQSSWISVAHVMRRTARKGLEVLRLTIYINIYVYIIVFCWGWDHIARNVEKEPRLEMMKANTENPCRLSGLRCPSHPLKASITFPQHPHWVIYFSRWSFSITI